MSAPPCVLCGNPTEIAFQSTILGKYDATYDSCPQCGLLRVRDPGWLEEAYAAPIAALDTGILDRSLGLANRLADVLLRMHGRGPFVDVAGGYGLLTRRMRDLGFEYFWVDEYAPNLVARGFEAAPGMKFAAASCIEVLEHLEDPLAFLRGVIDDWGVQTIVCTTETFESPVSPSWWYLTPQTGQHVTFFTPRTLACLAEKLEMNFASVRGTHIFSRSAIPARAIRLQDTRGLRQLRDFRRRRRIPGLTWTDHLDLSDRMGREVGRGASRETES